MSVDIDFRRLRPHDGSLDKAFEELCFQILEPTLPDYERLERPGAPDAGVELIIWRGDGSAWAWQSKFFTERLDDTELGQVKSSFETALKTYPEITQYTVCVPFNPPSEKPRGNRKSAMQKWRDAAKRWAEWAAERGSTVDIRYFGLSHLINELTKDEHAGRRLYWFDQTVLSDEWFARKLARAVRTAGPRYTPEVHVDLKVAEVFDGIGRADGWRRELLRHLAAIRKAKRYSLRLPDEDEDLKEHIDPIDRAFDALDSAVVAVDLSDGDRLDFDLLRRFVDAAEAALAPMSNALQERAYGGPAATEAVDPAVARKLKNDRERVLNDLWSIQSAARELAGFFDAPTSRLVNIPALLVSGPAGVGKTHLLCDAARSRLSAGLPTIMLMGQHFRTGDPWGQILDLLQLDCSPDELLGALSAAAQLRGSRALIFIDALNEGDGLRLWPDHLAAILEDLRHWPWIGLVVSCRESYRAQIVRKEIGASDLVVVQHAGFAGAEYRATKTFFEHYGLIMPDFPLVVPEFQNPLFLKLACTALQERGLKTLPREASAITWMFDEVLAAINERLADAGRCNFNQAQPKVRQALEALAIEMSATESEMVPFARAEELTDRILGRQGWLGSLLEGMVAEGLVAQDRIREEEVVFFGYQRLGDHLRATVLLAEFDTREEAADRVRERLGDDRAVIMDSGLFEALAIQLPERFGVELHELVDLGEAEDYVRERVEAAFLDSLVWRKPSAVKVEKASPFWLELANAHHWSRANALERLLEVACLPDHPLNAAWLHDLLLAQTSMAARDYLWTTALSWDTEEGSQLTRIIEWARSNDTAAVNDDAALLCSLVLGWCLTSPNRYIRDNATKGLVSLLHARPAVVCELLDRFGDVDDPYVAERIYAAAYGCALINQDPAAIEQLARVVYERVFARAAPAHVLLRDYARGVIERAVLLDALPEGVEIERCRPPYESDGLVFTEVTNEELADRYEREEFGSLLGLLGQSDFRIYTVDWEVRQFEGVETDEAARWILERVIALGWRPDLFRDYDREASRRRFRNEAYERIGKKYQWIALHELLARLADHVPYSTESWDRADRFEGPWQTHARDIDPSQLIGSIQSESWETIPTCWWAPVEVAVPDDVADDEREQWIRSDALPNPAALIVTTDRAGVEWLALEGHYQWKERRGPLDEEEGDQAELWYQLRSYLVRREDLEAVRWWATKARWTNRWMAESTDLDRVFIGEFPWHPSAANSREGWTSDVRGSAPEGMELPTEVLVTSTTYHWSGDDQSSNGASNVLVPAAFLLDKMDLSWSGNAFSYRDREGEIVADCPAAREPGANAVLVRRDRFARFLDDCGLAVVWTVLGEKRILFREHHAPPETSGRMDISASCVSAGGSVDELHFEANFRTYRELWGRIEGQRRIAEERRQAERTPLDELIDLMGYKVGAGHGEEVKALLDDAISESAVTTQDRDIDDEATGRPPNDDSSAS
jgi:hypothetical protein